jgi:hypothetical protein
VQEWDGAVAKYALEGLPNKVLAAEYRTTLPEERLLVEEIRRTRKQIEVRRELTGVPTQGSETARRPPQTLTCEHASNIDQLFGEHATTNQMVATPIGVQSGRRFTPKGRLK